MLTLATVGILAAISIEFVGRVVIEFLVLAAICWLLWWLVRKLDLGEPFTKIGRALVALLAVFGLISILLEVAGHPIFTW